MKKILLTLLLSGWFGFTMAQTIQKAEYFIDTDPGFGSGIAITFTPPPGNTVTIPLSIPISAGLGIGFHKFNVRAKDSNGKWSMVHSQNFYKTSSETVLNDDVVALEYFIDSDPGFGQAIQIPFSPGSQETVGLTIPIPQVLPLGFHKFQIRSKDANGKWSVVYSQNFFKTNELPTLPNITKLEYFVDTDPGFGLASNISISIGNIVNLNTINYNIPLGLLSSNHKLQVRAKDSNGKWSVVAIQNFTECLIGANITPSPAAVTCGTPITLNTSIQNDNSSVLNWTWLRNGVDIGSANQTSIQANSTGEYSISIVTTGNGTCNNTRSNVLPITILKDDSLKIKSNATFANCNTPAILSINQEQSFITNNLGITYTWFKNNIPISNSNSPIFSIKEFGTYKLQIGYGGGLSSCNQLISNTITIQDKKSLVGILPVSSLPSNILVCNGSSIHLNAQTDLTGILTYQWFKNEALLNTETNSFLNVINQPGNYKVSITAASCNALSSINYNVSFAGVPQGNSTMNLSSGLLTSCPGQPATLAVSGCTGEVEWNNGFVGLSLNVTQLNQSDTYTAICKNSCLQQVSNAQTLVPFGPTLVAPIVSVDDFPLKSSYSIIESSRSHGDAFRYNDFGAPVVVAPLNGGRNYFIDKFFNMNALKLDESYAFPFIGVDISPSSFTIVGKDIMLLKSETLLLAGYTNAGIIGQKSVASFGGEDFWILARNLNGTKLWDMAYGGSANDNCNKIIQLASGDILLAGTSSSGINGNKSSANFGLSDFWVVKTDALGNKISDFVYGGSGSEFLLDALLLQNGNILLVGSSNSNISGNKNSTSLGLEDVWLVVINENGTIIWEKTLGTNQSESGISAIEKDGKLFVGDEKGVYKLNLIGIQESYNSYNNDYYLPAISKKFYLQKVLKSPDNEIIVAGSFDGQAQIGNNVHPYGSIIFFEIDSNLSQLYQLNQTFGDYSSQDKLGAIFFDNQGSLHIIKSNDVPNCYQPCESCGFLDVSAYHNTLCNRGNITDGHWFQWVVSKFDFQNRSFTDYCKGKEFLVRAVIPDNETIGNVDFLWSDGQTGAIAKITSNTRLPLHVTYKPKKLLNTCGSAVNSINLFPFGDKLILAGNNVSDLSKKFAYKEISSSEDLGISANYKSEAAIILRPGFQINANINKTFEAKIEGCINE